MADERVPAIWRGPFDALDANMTVIHQGDERQVAQGDLLSGHWEAVKVPAPLKPFDEGKTLDKDGD